jgi:ATP synthase I chain
MTQNVNNAGDEPVLTVTERDEGLHSRIRRTMILSTVVAVGWSLFFSSWQVSSGLTIGGLLALLNHRWLESSIAAAFGVLIYGKTPRLTLGKYIFRYLVVATIAVAAYQLGVASLAAMIAGLCTFVVALVVEAFREFYLAIIRREEVG